MKGFLEPKSIVGIVNDVLRGGMYKLSLGEGDNTSQRNKSKIWK